MVIIILCMIYSQCSLQVQAQSIDTSPLDVLKEWIAVTEKNVDDGLLFIKNISRYVHNNLELSYNQYVNITRMGIDYIWSIIETKLISIKQNSNTDLQLVIDCIMKNEVALKDVPLQTSSEIARCIAGNTIPITNVTQFICSDLQRVQKKVRAATGQLKKCMGRIEKVFNCTVDIAHNVKQILQKIPDEVGANWSILMYNWESLVETYESCKEFDVTIAHKKYIKIYENISSCIISDASKEKNSNDEINPSVSSSFGNSMRWLMILIIPILIMT